MQTSKEGVTRILFKAVIAVGLATTTASLAPEVALAGEAHERCVWLNNGTPASCYRGCDAWVFTNCDTSGKQGCYDGSTGGICGGEGGVEN